MVQSNLQVMPGKKQHFLYRNGLSIVLLTLLLIFWTGQFVNGFKEHNKELLENNRNPVSPREYLSSGHFISATFENWESEFLQMAMYVLLTVWLRQKGSAESKKLEGEEGADEQPVDREPKPHPDSPWPVKKGGLWLTLYSNSLSITFGLLFIFSFWMHFAGSLADYNEEQRMKGQME